MCKVQTVKNQIKFEFSECNLSSPLFRGKDNIYFIRDGQKKRPQNDLRPLFYVKNNN